MEGVQEGGDMRIYVNVLLIHFVIQEKLTHHCKVIMFLLWWATRDILVEGWNGGNGAAAIL